jgi:hypothetical protein
MLRRRSWAAPVIVLVANGFLAAAAFAVLRESNPGLLFNAWWYAGAAIIETLAIMLPLAMLRSNPVEHAEISIDNIDRQYSR